jgi:hypothetical protein
MSAFRELAKQRKQHEPEQTGPQMCQANHCPCIATVQIEGGRWCCSSHAFAVSDKWPAITEGLRNHDWLLGFIADIQRMDRKTEDWRAFAEQFWDGQDDYCKPVAGEMVNGKRTKCEHVIPYFNRMKRELDYRLGLCKRPAPRITEDIGNLFMDLVKTRRAA